MLQQDSPSEQFGQLVTRIEERVMWDCGSGRPKALTLRQALKATMTYFETNTEEVIGERLFVDQATVCRTVSELEGTIAGGARRVHP